MIINFHPQELPSKKGVSVIEALNQGNTHEVVHVTSKTKEEWQAIINSNEELILVAPVYWWGASYEFDRWYQDVFSYGYAYEYQNGTPVGLLKKRPFALHLTHGTPTEYATTMLENIRTRFTQGVFGFCDAVVSITFHYAN